MTCNFSAFTIDNPTGTNQYTQAGYITCGQGGMLWQREKITIKNNGPGDFYIGPVSGKSSLDVINVRENYNYTFQNMYSPNIYYLSTSQYSKPNFNIQIE
jgi:hypothetical protein